MDQKVLDDLQEKLAQFHTEEEKEKQWETQVSIGSTVRISEDRMTAWLYLYPPVSEKVNYTMESLITFLKQRGIVYGINEKTLQEILQKKQYKEELLIAQGDIPDLGNDGYFEYFFQTDLSTQSKVREDGSVDYDQMESLANVHKNDCIARYHPAQVGTPGMDVNGEELPIREVKDVQAMRGNNVRYDMESGAYYAMLDGKAMIRDGRLDVQNHYEIHEDADYLHNIEFFGDIEIYGDVKAGAVIRAGRNIKVHGIVENAKLYAGGDIILGRGMQGDNQGKLSCNGNVYADFLEYTTVNCKGDVHANYILYSQISAGGRIFAEGKKGSIIGGKVQAMECIETYYAGNENEVKTLLQIDQNQRPRIIVHGCIYPGCIIALAKSAQLILEKKKNVCYYMDDFRLKEEQNGCE